MPIDSKHREFLSWSTEWTKIKDFCAGQSQIKAKRGLYLPALSGQDTEAYEGYLQRAQYVNFTNRTLQASVGQVLRRPPIVDGIDESLLDNIDLSGNSFLTMSKKIISDTVAFNRIGVWVDYSADQNRPYLTAFDCQSIINWQSRVINGIRQLSLVVIEGLVDDMASDPYNPGQKKTWIELKLDEGDIYTVNHWEFSKQSSKPVIMSTAQPKMDGVPFDYIPFFIVSSGGDPLTIQKSALSDIVDVNHGHYINSADYENMLHWTGCKTLAVKGVQEGATIPVGGCLVLPVDGDAAYIEASSDSGLKEAMQKKEEQIAVLGTALVSGKGRYVASAETARISASGEYATLADIANAVSMWMSKILTLMSEWASGGPVSVQYNTDYELADMPQGKLTELMGAYQQGLISWETFFYQLQQYEFYPVATTAEQEKAATEEQQQEAIKRRDDAITAQVANMMTRESGQTTSGSAADTE